MKDTYINQAVENGHTMVRVSPDRYECQCCPAAIEKDETGRDWYTIKINTICPEAKVKLTPKFVPRRFA